MWLDTNPTHVLITEFDYGDADNGANIVKLNLNYTFEDYPKYTVQHFLDTIISILRVSGGWGNLKEDEEDSFLLKKMYEVYPDVDKQWLHELVWWEIFHISCIYDQFPHSITNIDICPIEHYKKLY